MGRRLNYGQIQISHLWQSGMTKDVQLFQENLLELLTSVCKKLFG